MLSRVLAAVLIGASVLAPAATAAPPAPSGPAASATGTCSGKSDAEGGTTLRHQIHSGGRERSFRVHLPEGYEAAKPSPLVVVYHGRGSSAELTQGFSGLDGLPAVVAYADGVIGTGDGNRQAWEGAPYSAPGVDDVAFTEDLLDRLAADYCIDERRVYATGKSNGAGLVGILACDLADRFAAVAPVAGAHYATGHPDCTPARPVPMISFHGSADATIPYVGDPDRGLPAIADWSSDWAARNHCHHRRDGIRLADDVTERRWVGCRKGAEVRLVTVDGGGHTWPGADAYSGGGYTTQNVEAADLMWDFFRRHRLPR